MQEVNEEAVRDARIANDAEQAFIRAWSFGIKRVSNPDAPGHQRPPADTKVTFRNAIIGMSATIGAGDERIERLNAIAMSASTRFDPDASIDINVKDLFVREAMAVISGRASEYS